MKGSGPGVRLRGEIWTRRRGEIWTRRRGEIWTRTSATFLAHDLLRRGHLPQLKLLASTYEIQGPRAASPCALLPISAYAATQSYVAVWGVVMAPSLKGVDHVRGRSILCSHVLHPLCSLSAPRGRSRLLLLSLSFDLCRVFDSKLHTITHTWTCGVRTGRPDGPRHCTFA